MAAKQAAGEDDFLAAAARLACAARVGTLATAAAGQPHAALVTPALLPDGQPLLLLSALSIHTRQLQQDPRCCLLLLGAPADDNPQTTPRLALSGHAKVTTTPAAAPAFLRAHPYAALYAGFGDFAYWRLVISDAQYIGGFAAACRLEVAALQYQIIRNFPPPAVDASGTDGL